MKKFLLYCATCAFVFASTLTSCKSDDDDNPDLSPDVKELVNSSIPQTKGWEGNTANGILKYAPESYDADDINSFFAFNMKNGTCETAVYNLVMPNANIARHLVKMVNDGTWVNEEEDDEPDYYKIESRATTKLTKKIFNTIKKAYSSRADITLPIQQVHQDGKVIYITIPNMSGISSTDLKIVVEYWTGDRYIIPNKVVFGEYENGVYTCKNLYCMNIDYLVTTQFNEYGFCSQYVTELNLPTYNWAQFFYEEMNSSLDEYESTFGERPTLSINNRSVALDALIHDNVPQNQIDVMIYYLDWANNRPFIFSLFN